MTDTNMKDMEWLIELKLNNPKEYERHMSAIKEILKDLMKISQDVVQEVMQ